MFSKYKKHISLPLALCIQIETGNKIHWIIKKDQIERKDTPTSNMPTLSFCQDDYREYSPNLSKRNARETVQSIHRINEDLSMLYFLENAYATPSTRLKSHTAPLISGLYALDLFHLSKLKDKNTLLILFIGNQKKDNDQLAIFYLRKSHSSYCIRFAINPESLEHSKHIFMAHEEIQDDIPYQVISLDELLEINLKHAIYPKESYFLAYAGLCFLIFSSAIFMFSHHQLKNHEAENKKLSTTPSPSAENRLAKKIENHFLDYSIDISKKLSINIQAMLDQAERISIISRHPVEVSSSAKKNIFTIQKYERKPGKTYLHMKYLENKFKDCKINYTINAGNLDAKKILIHCQPTILHYAHPILQELQTSLK